MQREVDCVCVWYRRCVSGRSHADTLISEAMAQREVVEVEYSDEAWRWVSLGCKITLRGRLKL